MRAKTILNLKIFYFLSVFLVDPMYFDIQKTDNNQIYNFPINTFNLDETKQPYISEKMAPIVISKSNINPVFKVDSFYQFPKNTLYNGKYIMKHKMITCVIDVWTSEFDHKVQASTLL